MDKISLVFQIEEVFVIMKAMTSLSNIGKPLWNKLTRKVFACPSCAQKLRVPIRPGKSLSVQCSRCPSQFILDFKIPLIEVFRWQSGKSLKQNLIDFHHRFWNLPVAAKLQVMMILFLMAMIIDAVISPLFSYYLLPLFKSGNNVPAESLSSDYIRSL